MKSQDQIGELRTAIESGKLAPGEMVGTEFAFSQKWGLYEIPYVEELPHSLTKGCSNAGLAKGALCECAQYRNVNRASRGPDLSWTHVVRIVRGAQEVGLQKGLHTQVYDADHGQLGLDLEMLRRLPDGPTDGAIIISLTPSPLYRSFGRIKSTGYPFVLVDQRLHDIEVPTVEIDNYGGGYVVGQKLAEMGHHRVGFLGPMSLQVVADRMNGFRDATLDAGVLFDRSLVVDLGGDGVADWLNTRLEATQDGVNELLKRPDRPTAIFDGSGDVAAHLSSCSATRAKVPEDVSVVSFDDSAKFSQYLDQQSANSNIRGITLGRAAMEVLVPSDESL